MSANTEAEPADEERRRAPMLNTTRLAIGFLLLVTVAVAACQSIPAVGSFAPIGNGPLVSITVRGGDCPEGACGGTTVIEHDGRVHRTAPRPPPSWVGSPVMSWRRLKPP